MPDRAPIRQGSIVWATVPDPRRGNPKRRPLIILTADDDIVLDEPIVAVAVTTTFADPAPQAFVELPHEPRFGHPATRLRRRSAAACAWLVTMRPSDVGQVGGYVPGRTMLRIIETVRRLNE